MSERTFRAVVAAVLVGALALAIAVAAIFLTRSVPSPSTTPSLGVSTPEPTSTQTPASTRTPGPALTASAAVGVGQIARGASSAATLVLEFLETSPDTIPDAAGSCVVTLVDHADNGSTLHFVGEPTVIGPGSLGASTVLVSPGVLQLSIVGADPHNVELMTVRGLGIGASTTAAIGQMSARLSGCTGSLSGVATSTIVGPVGSVTGAPN